MLSLALILFITISLYVIRPHLTNTLNELRREGVGKSGYYRSKYYFIKTQYVIMKPFYVSVLLMALTNADLLGQVVSWTVFSYVKAILCTLVMIVGTGTIFLPGWPFYYFKEFKSIPKGSFDLQPHAANWGFMSAGWFLYILAVLNLMSSIPEFAKIFIANFK